MINLGHVFIPFVEILIIAIMLNYVLSFFWKTRAMDIIVGFTAFLLIFLIASWFNLPVLEKITLYFFQFAVIATLIIFQPELRIALSKLTVLRGRKYRVISEFDSFLEDISQSVYDLSRKKIGALIVLENRESLDEYAEKAVLLEANFSSELIESIFPLDTPLHDGAVIVRETMVLAAAAILPLAEESSQITKSMGTRHRAALGITQQTDAIAIVVSEETGRVSIARDGVIRRGIGADRFKSFVRSVFTSPKIKTELKLFDWLK